VILWLDGSHSPAENMRRDGALLQAFEAGRRGDAVLRLFRFEPHGITLGASQNPARALDLERCRRDEIPWAVRPTGGRAIFHAEEWTYSLSARQDDPVWGGDLRRAYAAVARWIQASLVRLGVPVGSAPEARSDAASHPSALACFARAGGHELVIGGRKLVGSAQRRLAHAFLQQGSLLLGPGHLRLADYLAIPEADRAGLKADLAARTVHAGRWLGDAPLQRWAEALEAVLEARFERREGEAGLSLIEAAERSARG
jgi:lipoate-protein ligase A